jgi:hypothetical protein
MLGGIYPSVFFLFQTTNAYFQSRDYFPHLLSWLATMLILLAFSAYIFYPAKFQRHFKLLGVDPAGENFLFSFKNPDYLQIFMELNPMHAEVIEESISDTL